MRTRVARWHPFRVWLFGLLVLGGEVRPAMGWEPLIATTTREIHEMPPEEAAEAISVHLHGTVTYYQPEERNLFLEDETGGVYIKVSHPYPFPIRVGDRVEVDGFTESSFRTIVADGAGAGNGAGRAAACGAGELRATGVKQDGLSEGIDPGKGAIGDAGAA